MDRFMSSQSVNFAAVRFTRRSTIKCVLYSEYIRITREFSTDATNR